MTSYESFLDLKPKLPYALAKRRADRNIDRQNDRATSGRKADESDPPRYIRDCRRRGDRDGAAATCRCTVLRFQAEPALSRCVGGDTRSELCQASHLL